MDLQEKSGDNDKIGCGRRKQWLDRVTKRRNMEERNVKLVQEEPMPPNHLIFLVRVLKEVRMRSGTKRFGLCPDNFLTTKPRT